MTDPDRKARAQRTTALTLGVMPEMCLGTILVMWSGGSSQPRGREAFGHTGSVIAVVVAMVALAFGLLVLATARHLNRVTHQIAMGVTSLGFVGVAIMGVVALNNTFDIAFLLLASCALSIPVVRGIERASETTRRKR